MCLPSLWGILVVCTVAILISSKCQVLFFPFSPGIWESLVSGSGVCSKAVRTSVVMMVLAVPAAIVIRALASVASSREVYESSTKGDMLSRQQILHFSFCGSPGCLVGLNKRTVVQGSRSGCILYRFQSLCRSSSCVLETVLQTPRSWND